MIIWFIAAVAILIIELFLGTIYLLVISAAFFGAGLAHALFASLPITISVAAILSAIGLWWANNWIRRHRTSAQQEAAINDLDIGQMVKILEHRYENNYLVFYRGIQWQAETPTHNTPLPPKSHARIIGRNGNTLIIQPTTEEA